MNNILWRPKKRAASSHWSEAIFKTQTFTSCGKKRLSKCVLKTHKPGHTGEKPLLGLRVVTSVTIASVKKCLEKPYSSSHWRETCSALNFDWMHAFAYVYQNWIHFHIVINKTIWSVWRPLPPEWQAYAFSKLHSTKITFHTWRIINRVFIELGMICKPKTFPIT